MRAWVWAVPVLAMGAVTAAALAVTTPPPPHAARSHRTGGRSAADHHPASRTVTAAESGSGRFGSMIVTDPYAAGSKLRRAEYHLRDGYTKRVIIPGGAYVLAEDIAICGEAGKHYPDNGFTGTGLPCRPALHPAEVRYHQRIGDLAGRFHPHRHAQVTEIASGQGRYLTVGHIDHGALISVEYYWVNGEHLTVLLRGDVLVGHIRVITSGGRLGAAVARYR